jgi:hypothetical protein
MKCGLQNINEGHDPYLYYLTKTEKLNLLADMTQLTATESQIPASKDAQVQQLKKSRPDMTFLMMASRP